MDVRKYAELLRSMADYVNGIPQSPDNKKRDLFKRAKEEQGKHHHQTAIELFKECLKTAQLIGAVA